MNKSSDKIFITMLFLLVTFGIIMIFSSTYAISLIENGDGFFYVKRMLMFGTLGLFSLLFFARLNYKYLRKYYKVFLFLSVFVMLLLLTPLGVTVRGATRWVNFGGPFSFMPAELAKIGLIIGLAGYLDNLGSDIKQIHKFILPILGLLITFSYLVIKVSSDLSSGIIINFIIVVMVFLAGIKMRWVVISGLSSAFLSFYYVKNYMLNQEQLNYRAERIIAFIDPWAYAQGSGYQIIQSLIALGSGGMFGRGLGQSVQKHYYLPDQHTDFIFSIIAEELGFFGASIILLIFLILIWRGIKIALNAPDNFSFLLVSGIISVITIQLIINIAVVTSSIPVTGIPLPFISYGGSALLVFLTSCGIVINISRYKN